MIASQASAPKTMARAGDDGGDLKVGAEPEGELAPRTAVALDVGDHVDVATLDAAA